MPRPGPFGKAKGWFRLSPPRFSPRWFRPSLVIARSGATKQSMGASRAAEPWIAASGSALLAMTRSILRRSSETPEAERPPPASGRPKTKIPRRGQRPNGRSSLREAPNKKRPARGPSPLGYATRLIPKARPRSCCRRRAAS
jgi:hypothetical protein